MCHSSGPSRRNASGCYTWYHHHLAGAEKWFLVVLDPDRSSQNSCLKFSVIMSDWNSTGCHMVRSDFSGRETSDFRCTQSRFYRDTNHLWSGVCIIGFSLDPKDSENCTQSPFDLNKGLSVCLSKQRNLSAGVSRSKPYALDLGGNPDWVETASGWLTVMRKIRRRRVLRMIFGPPCDQFFFWSSGTGV